MPALTACPSTTSDIVEPKAVEHIMKCEPIQVSNAKHQTNECSRVVAAEQEDRTVVMDAEAFSRNHIAGTHLHGRRNHVCVKSEPQYLQPNLSGFGLESWILTSRGGLHVWE